ncbi:MAG TPA: hypothetical protein DCX03_11960 [Bacteroidales bacterium]|nr:hypothetical protein [Bacteroidales bacterium]
MGHLTQEQRYTISQMLGNGYRKIEIDRVIGVDKSTVIREIKRKADGRDRWK